MDSEELLIFKLKKKYFLIVKLLQFRILLEIFNGRGQFDKLANI